MPAKVIRLRERVQREEFSLFFAWNGDPNSGFSFDCTADGTVLLDALQPEGLANLRKCEDGTHAVDSPVIERAAWSYWEPGLLRCHCGAEVYLDGFTNTCDNCGADYDSRGNRLAPRAQWGYDTGESLSDILAIP